MKLNLKVKTIISIVLFVAVFAALIAAASVCDYKISEIMTKGTLDTDAGDYYAHGFFGVMLECFGCTPLYFLGAFLLCVLFWACLKVWEKKPLNIICAVVLGIGVVVVFWYALKDTMGYVFEHAAAASGFKNIEALDKLEHSAALFGIEFAFGIVMGACALLATMHFKPETLKKLLKFVLATVVALLVANVIVMIVKNPIGRMRFRAINSTLGKGMIEGGVVSGYTNWYVINKQPNEGILNAFKDAYGVKDAFKSFPSGHTCSCGSVYALIMIPTLFDFKNHKNKKVGILGTVLCWALPILCTALVAISRIMVGAHYMSDVTFGGTLAFVCCVIAWEIFICKGSHFFALFPMAQKQKAVAAADGESVEDSSLEVCDSEGCDTTGNLNDDEINEEVQEEVEETLGHAEEAVDDEDPQQSNEVAEVAEVAEDGEKEE